MNVLQASLKGIKIDNFMLQQVVDV